AEYARNRTGRTDGRDVRRRVERRMRERRGNAARDIEDCVADVTEAVLDVVAEDPEVEHVAADVQETAVQEHRREHRHDVALPIAWNPEVPRDECDLEQAALQ